MAGSNTKKAYKQLTGTSSFYDAESSCRADGAWIVTPRTPTEVTDILGYGCKDYIISGESDAKDIINHILVYFQK